MRGLLQAWVCPLVVFMKFVSPVRKQFSVVSLFAAVCFQIFCSYENETAPEGTFRPLKDAETQIKSNYIRVTSVLRQGGTTAIRRPCDC